MAIQRERQIQIWYFVVAIAGVLLAQVLMARNPAPEIPYSAFQSLLAKGEVTDITVGPDTITGRYTTPTPGKPDHFTTYRVEPSLAREIAKAGVTFSGEPGPGLVARFLGWLLPMAAFLALWFFLIRRMGGPASGMLSIGRSKVKIYVENDIKTTFADVAGVDEAKDELREVVAFLKDPARYGRLGAHVPRGILLVGPPGTGKTLLARAVAGEAGVPFFSISGSEFVEMFVGVGAARVRDLFERARGRAPAIIFIDELDALGRARMGTALPGNDEKEQTLNQLLAELDGFDPKSGVVLLAATNRPEILDPALLRAGRFDRQVLVDRPDRRGRVDILRVHLKKIRLASGVAVEDIAALTPGFTGADLASLVNEAALLATRRNGEDVTLEDFTQAVERVVAGLEKKNRLLNPHEREVVAYHEAGHALVAMALPGVDPVQKISIIPRGIGALGYTMQRPLEDRFLMSKAELNNRLAVLLGGRVAEGLVFGEISTGAADDLAKATEIARDMVVRYGMDEQLGQVTYETGQSSFLQPHARTLEAPRYSDATASAIDRAVRDRIDAAARGAGEILQGRMEVLRRVAQALLTRETLSAEELRALTAIPPHQSPPPSGTEPLMPARPPTADAAC